MIPLRYQLLLSSVIILLTFIALDKYIGEWYIFLWFTITSNALLLYGFRKKAIFFDTFIGVFLWLGFWLKTTIRVIFLNNEFSEGLKDFEFSNAAFDEALLVSGFAFLILILASYFREKFIFNYTQENREERSSLFLFYKDFRKAILIFYALLFIFIAWSNFQLGIYQRGELTQTNLPFGLNGVYKWLLLFGLSSFAAIILKFEFSLHKKATLLVPLLTLIEAFFTSVSLLSRGMILNTSALGYGMIHYLKLSDIITNKKFWFTIIFGFIILFLFSITTVNQLRQHNVKVQSIENINISNTLHSTKILFLDRWVGIEGMIAVASSEQKGWSLFYEAIDEKFDEHKTSFYDLNLINSAYINMDTSKNHYISLPGFIAFFYYTGSIAFLSIIMFSFSIIASYIEIIAYKLGGKNLILSALIAQVIAYRFTHFGYVPMQSYLLFGSIFLNIFLIYLVEKILSFFYTQENNSKWN